ncbi:MAG: hypothetical protein GTO41_22880 [Burkholderiales bacterium]|nr:hypothetical protein [Burkholderiales bacterium]
MKRFLCCIALTALSLSGFAVEDEEEFLINYERQESLEIPGLTAGCHICEWRPKLNQKPAPEQCGLDASGEAIIGLFECGFSQDCERVCNLLACGEN